MFVATILFQQKKFKIFYFLTNQEIFSIFLSLYFSSHQVAFHTRTSMVGCELQLFLAVIQDHAHNLNMVHSKFKNIKLKSFPADNLF